MGESTSGSVKYARSIVQIIPCYIDLAQATGYWAIVVSWLHSKHIYCVSTKIGLSALRWSVSSLSVYCVNPLDKTMPPPPLIWWKQLKHDDTNCTAQVDQPHSLLQLLVFTLGPAQSSVPSVPSNETSDHEKMTLAWRGLFEAKAFIGQSSCLPTAVIISNQEPTSQYLE